MHETVMRMHLVFMRLDSPNEEAKGKTCKSCNSHVVYLKVLLVGQKGVHQTSAHMWIEGDL